MESAEESVCDSIIEEVFFEKCKVKKTYRNVMFEWINSKKIYEDYTGKIYKSYQNYSKHDKSHSIAILDCIYAIIGKDRIRDIEVMDLWLLLHCAYAHDIGMPYTYDEAKRFWETIGDKNSEFGKFFRECIESTEDKDAKEAAEYIIGATKKIWGDILNSEWSNINFSVDDTFEYIWPLKVARYCEYLLTEFCRKNHAERSKEFMERKADESNSGTPYVVSSRFYKVIAACSLVHGEEFDAVLKLDANEWARESDCHPPFVAALLRLGDLLDIDNNRFDSIALKLYGKLPYISELHKMKHEAITHIAIADDKIEVRAKSSNLEVCKCVNSWFQYIEREVRNLIFHWGDIAPEKMKGCRLTLPKLKIFYKEQEFSSYESHEFSVNKDMLIKLVIGRNLYASKLDFIREYLQNAMDALKMKFWVDLQDGVLDIEIKEDVLKKLKGDYHKLTPMDFKSSVFRRYAIEVICSFMKKDGYALVEIKICDRGIGIEEECIKAISNIGSGWKRRPYYKKYLGNMPTWLQPTGGFGIGIQSGFMVVDKVTIRTKCEKESMGRQVTLYSSALSGKIEEQQYELPHTGTEIIIQIPYEKIMDNYEYKGEKLIDESKCGDFFDPDQIMRSSLNILEAYISIVANASILPIIIKRKGCKPTSISNELEENTRLVEEIETDGYHYRIYAGMENIYIWRVEDSILCRFLDKKERKEERISWYYKGMSVEEREKQKTHHFLKVFPEIELDIMGGKVDDFLTVDRNQFVEKVDCEKIVHGFLKTYYKSGKCVEAWLHNYEKSMDVDSEKGYWFIWAFFYVRDEELRNKIKEKVNFANVRDKYEGIVYSTINKRENVHEKMEQDEKSEKRDRISLDGPNKNEKKMDRGAISLLRVCGQLWENESIYIINRDTAEKNIESLEDIDDKFINKEIILSKDLYDIFSHFHIPNINILNSRKTDDKPEIIEYKYIEPKNDENQNFSKKIVPSLIDARGSYAIFWASDAFKELQVNRLPWNYKASEPQENFGNQEIHMIISPIRPIQMEWDILDRTIEGKEEPYDEIRKVVLEDDSFTYLVNWVYEHQVTERTYTKDVIREKYGEFLQWWYENMFLKKKNL